MLFNPIGSGGSFSGELNFKNYTTYTGDATSGIIFGNGKFLAFGGKASLYSNDGKTWTTGKTFESSIYNIVFDAGKFIASTINGQYYSTDGITWTSAGNLAIGSSILVHGCGKFYIYGTNGTLASSSNGITWTKTSYNDPWKCSYQSLLSLNNNMFVYGNSNSYVCYDGATWTKTDLIVDSSVSGIHGIYIDGKYFIVYHKDSKEIMCTSYNGINWTHNEINLTVSLSSFFHYNGQFFVSNSNKMYYSSDVLNWNECKITKDTSQYLTYLACGNGVIVACGGYNSGIATADLD